MGVGGSPVPVGRGAEPPADGRWSVRGELVGPGGALAQVVGVPVGAGGVAGSRAGSRAGSGPLTSGPGSHSALWFGDADQAAVGVVEQDEPGAQRGKRWPAGVKFLVTRRPSKRDAWIDGGTGPTKTLILRGNGTTWQ